VASHAACLDRPGTHKARAQVGDIARAHGAALRESCALWSEQLVVLRALERCRTAALGGHLYECDGCGHTVPMYNSCRNRHCPTCQSLAQRRWLERRHETILPTPYFHVVFTLPSELRPLAVTHRELLFSLLFEAAQKTLLLLSNDPKRLGATPAITMVLHTWSRQLSLHPHVHAIVSAGGLAKDGSWKACREDYLFPVNVMKRLFRRLFRDGLLSAVADGTITMAPDMSASVRSALFEKKWVVYAKAPFGGAKQVFAYLGRYTHRVGPSNARIQHVSEHSVTFATKHGRSCTLEPVELLRRFLLHVLPKGYQKIRHYGLCSGPHVARGTLERARQQLTPSPDAGHRSFEHHVRDDAGSAPDNRPTRTPDTWIELLLALTGVNVRACPRCASGRMRIVAVPLNILRLPAAVDTS